MASRKCRVFKFNIININNRLQVEETKQQVKFRLSIPPEIEAEEEGKNDEDDLLLCPQDENYPELQAELFALKLEASNIQMKYNELVLELSNSKTNMTKTNSLISMLVECVENDTVFYHFCIYVTYRILRISLERLLMKVTNL